MTTERKVRADFDLTKEYSVDVSKCTDDEKKQVQQAFFDVGLRWSHEPTGEEYQFLSALQYTNTRSSGMVTRRLLYAHGTKCCNMTPAEFLELVYEPEQRGHVHAELMALYAEDAKTTDKPWELWQAKDKYMDNVWLNLDGDPIWHDFLSFRRKPKTHTVNGVEVPDLRIKPEIGDRYYLVDLTEREFTYDYTAMIGGAHSLWAKRGLCYEHTEEGKQAAILHAKAMLGVAV